MVRPLTLQHFAPVFDWLDQRGAEPAQTDHHWTMDFAARRQTAHNEAEPHRREAERMAREASSKAQAIEDAVYDLKAVNPRERKVVDQRSPAQLLQAIVLKGREVDEALAQLQALVGPA